MNDNLTPKQSEVYDYVKAAMREKGYCPTVREICLAVGLTSTSSVHAHLNTLERRIYPAEPVKTAHHRAGGERCPPGARPVEDSHSGNRRRRYASAGRSEY